jgi:hypothetical protein
LVIGVLLFISKTKASVNQFDLHCKGKLKKKFSGQSHEKNFGVNPKKNFRPGSTQLEIFTGGQPGKKFSGSTQEKIFSHGREKISDRDRRKIPA